MPTAASSNARRNREVTSNASAIAIRSATLADVPALAALGAATFTETFGHLYAAEDLGEYLGRTHGEDAWARLLTDPQRAVWIAMLTHERAIGFVTVGACKLPLERQPPKAGEIQQLYVLERYQKHRIGSRLMDVGLRWLESRNCTPLYVGVWSQNLGAQRFYGRYGFQIVGEYGFPVGRTVDREFIMMR